MLRPIQLVRLQLLTSNDLPNMQKTIIRIDAKTAAGVINNDSGSCAQADCACRLSYPGWCLFQVYRFEGKDIVRCGVDSHFNPAVVFIPEYFEAGEIVR